MSYPLRNLLGPNLSRKVSASISNLAKTALSSLLGTPPTELLLIAPAYPYWSLVPTAATKGEKVSSRRTGGDCEEEQVLLSPVKNHLCQYMYSGMFKCTVYVRKKENEH